MAGSVLLLTFDGAFGLRLVELGGGRTVPVTRAGIVTDTQKLSR